MFIFLQHELICNLKEYLQLLHKIYPKTFQIEADNYQQWGFIRLRLKHIFLCVFFGTEIKIFSIKKRYEKVQPNKNILYPELSSKPNVDIDVITVSIWKTHDFEAISTSNDVMKIQNGIGKGFGSIEIAYSMGVNAYFGPIHSNRPHTTPNHGPG